MDTLEALPEAAEQENAYDEATDTSKPISLLDAVGAPNLVPLLDQHDVNRIGYEALREYETDKETLSEYHQRLERAMNMAMQKTTPKTFPWAGASNVVFPLLTQAAIQFNARTLPAIIDGDQVVKCAVLGRPSDEKRERADRVAAHMNWQLLNQVKGWRDDTDKLTLRLPIIGCVLREVWYDPVTATNCSEAFSALDFVIDINTPSLDKAPRYTRIKRYYPHEIEAYIRTGLWERVPYEGDDGSDPHSIVKVLEQFRLIDMDDDGLAEPYVVTLTEDGHVFRIVACYDADGMFFVSQSGFDGQKALPDMIREGVPEDAKLARIERREYIVKYGFIPSPDGTFFDLGLGTLTDALGSAVNTIINQLIDAGTLANMQGGFIGGGIKLRSGGMRFTPGEWKRVDGASAGPLRDNILPLQLPGPSATLFQLLGMLTEAVKNITSVSDIMAGNQESQTAPTTALALIEQGQKVFTAIIQRIHQALGTETKIMFRLNRDHLDVEEYFALNDVDGTVGRKDYQTSDLDIQPVTDPRALNDHAKMARAQILMSHNGDPLVNQMEIRKREFEAAGIDNIQALLDVPAPPPPPDLVAKAEQMAAAARASDAMTARTLIEAAAAAYALGVTINDPNIQQQTMSLLNEGIALADSVGAQMKGQGNEPVDGAGAVPGMAGRPGDAGLPAIPSGPGDVAGDALGGAPSTGGQPGDAGGAMPS